MSDQKKPETISDDDLDAVQGAGKTMTKPAGTSYANLEVSHARTPAGKDAGSGKIIASAGDGSI